MSLFSNNLLPVALCILVQIGSGCSQTEPPAATDTNAGSEHKTPVESLDKANLSNAQASEKENNSGDDLPVITFGGGSSNPLSKVHDNSEKESSASEAEAIISHLKELQVLLGTWRGITKKTYGGFKAVDQTRWVWDFQTTPAQPALVMSSGKSPYYRHARMTFLPASNQYQLSLSDTQGKTTTYLGKFTAPIEDIQGDDKTPQRTFKLEFTQTSPSEDKATRFVFNQKNNNRYLLEYYRQRGADERFFRVDTVSTQREGTSFALIDEGYGKKTCIISGGLGTTTVSYQGTTYYVCCSGCKAAFEEDPEKWIARAKMQKK